MKTVFAFLTLCGAILYVEGTCSLGDCTLGSAITGTAGCTTYQTYIDCLTTSKGGCTDSIVDVATSQTIQTAIDANALLKQALSCGGSTTITCSLSSCSLGSASCTAYNNYITCLGTAKGKCGSSDSFTKTAIETAITVNTGLRDALQCGGSIVSVSVVSLLLFAAIAALFN